MLHSDQVRTMHETAGAWRWKTDGWDLGAASKLRGSYLQRRGAFYRLAAAGWERLWMRESEAARTNWAGVEGLAGYACEGSVSVGTRAVRSIRR
jgi:hypothetical protein